MCITQIDFHFSFGRLSAACYPWVCDNKSDAIWSDPHALSPGGRGHANDVNGMGEVTSPFCAPPRVGDGRGREPGRADPTCDARIPGSVIFS